MRKILAGMLVVFVAAFAYGATLHRADAGPCYYKCVCSKPMRCCVNNGVETCKPAVGFQCTQAYPC